MIDANLNVELLSESADIKDAPNATPIPLQTNPVLAAVPVPLSYRSDKGVPTTAMTQMDLEKGDPALSSRSASSAAQINGVSVEFRNISFHYPAQDPLKGLHNVNIFIAPGTTTAIVGHTGRTPLFSPVFVTFID